MLAASIASMVWLALATVAAADPPPVVPVGEVAYVHAEEIFVLLDTPVLPGVELWIRSSTHRAVRAEVVESGALRAIVRLRDAAPWIRPGDTVLGAEPATTKSAAKAPPAPAVAATPAPPAVAAQPRTPWSPSGLPYPKVDADRPLAPLPTAARHTRVALRGAAWLWLERGDADFQRDSLEIVARGPLDAAGDFVLDADLRLTGQLLVPADARDRAAQTVYFDIYRANLTYEGLDPFWFSLGRRPSTGFRWGLLDGAAAGWRFAPGQTLELALGVRPDPGSLWPEHFHPAVSLSLDGEAAWSPARLDYRIGAVWLGGDGFSADGLESDAAASLDLFGWLDLDAELGVLALTPPGAAATATVDVAGAGVSVRLADRVSVRVSGRRIADGIPFSDRDLLPAFTAVADPRWDLSSYGDLYIGRLGALAVELTAAGGAILDENSGETRGWVAPGLNLRLVSGLGAWLRLGYRLEAGNIGGQLGEVALGLEPSPGLRFDLSQQAGIWALAETRTILPTASTWLRFTWRPIDILELAVRARARYGDTGTAFELDGQVAAVDFW